MIKKMEWMKFGEIKPKGWIYDQILRDLNGFVGNLDVVVPDLIVKDDIYGKNRLTKNDKSKDVGAIAQDAAWEVQYLWWNSETQSNWWDGLIRSAFLTENNKYIEKAKEYIEKKLSTQDNDGYLGIYAKDLRFKFKGENGELWAIATLLRGMLAYYEATGEESVFCAIERALAVVMGAYPKNNSYPFRAKNSYAGITHGLTITDVFDRMHQLTGKEEYSEYAVWFFEDYNKHKLMEEDILVKNLLKPNYKFKGHGVHTYEHLRALTIAAYNSDNEIYKSALKEYLKKLEKCITPGGGPIGDEWVARKDANASKTGYEYCSLHELLDSYSLLMQKSRDLSYADKIEHLIYNSGQGARHPEEDSIAYLKTDNSYELKGKAQFDEPNPHHTVQTRYKYSPSHQDAAVCCVPNAGRIYPYFVKSMWLKNSDGFIAALYGPNEFESEIDGERVKIMEETLYPFDYKIRFTIELERTKQFNISMRKPKWAKKTIIKSEGIVILEEDNLITLSKEWKNGDSVEIEFFPEIEINRSMEGEYYITRGNIVFAVPIAGESSIVKEYNGGFRDLYYTAKDRMYEGLTIDESEKILEQVNDGEKDLWNKIILKAPFINVETGKKEIREMVPMGGTILRRVTFPMG